MNENTLYENPVIFADVPDPSVIRVKNTYYMTSTTMHFCPGCPVMKSYDLVNWALIGYVYDTLDDGDESALRNGKNAYGKGSWASSLKYNDGVFYVVFSSFTVKKTYVFKTCDIESGKWERHVLRDFYHDMSLIFDNGRAFLIHGGGKIRIRELLPDATAEKDGGLDKVIIENANVSAEGLNAEGSHAYKINGKYYIFLITWPKGGRRIELCYRADAIDGEYKGRIVHDDTLDGEYYNNAGVAQGGVIETLDGKWYSMLFQDRGAVGRAPCLIPITWEDGYPVYEKTPKTAPVPVIVQSGKVSADISDDFDDDKLALHWQWNHNPNDGFWSLSEHKGFLRLRTSGISADIEAAQNTLTTRTYGPFCSGVTVLETCGMNDGDFAGLTAFQKDYGFVGVSKQKGRLSVVMSNRGEIIESADLKTDARVYLKIDCDFIQCADKAYFFYSLDGEQWTAIGNALQMSYTIPHFTGYRFALFNYATEQAGGYADFDFLQVTPAKT